VKAKAEPRILHCDNHVLAVAKPARWPVVADASGDLSLQAWAKEWVRREFSKPGEVFLGVVHRLDRPVSGIVVFGRTSKGADRLSRAWRESLVHKEYEALVELALPVNQQGRTEQWLLKDRSRNVVQLVSEGTPNAKLAVTDYKVVANSAETSLLALNPVTGRSHQLRLACARALQAPIVGDRKYGSQRAMADRRIALHAARLTLPHPTRDEEIALEWPTPFEL